MSNDINSVILEAKDRMAKYPDSASVSGAFHFLIYMIKNPSNATELLKAIVPEEYPPNLTINVLSTVNPFALKLFKPLNIECPGFKEAWIDLLKKTKSNLLAVGWTNDRVEEALKGMVVKDS